MNLEDSNIEINNKTTQYNNKLETLKSQMPAILSDFKKYYILYNKDTTNNEYTTLFLNITSNLENVNTNLTLLSNEVQVDINKINKELISLNSLIEEEKTTYKNLNSKLGIVEHKNNATTELITDYKQMYEYGYLRNWGLFFSIVLAGYTISKVFTNNTSIIKQ